MTADSVSTFKSHSELDTFDDGTTGGIFSAYLFRGALFVDLKESFHKIQKLLGVQFGFFQCP